MRTKQRKLQGFTLIELSILLAIGALVATTALVTRQDTSGLQKINDSTAKYERIAKALSSYYAAFDRLPCPADPRLRYPDAAAGAATEFGQEVAVTVGPTRCDITALPQADADDFVSVGAVPTGTLGLHPDDMTDSWGNRITYVVSNIMLTAPVAGNSAIAILGEFNPSSMDFESQITANSATFITNHDAVIEVDYALISYGKDGLGAYISEVASGDTTVNRNNSARVTYTAETINYGNLGTGAFDRFILKPNKSQQPNDSNDLANFDDIVFWGNVR